MKAYEVWVDDSDKGSGIVFAENSNQARFKAQHMDACEDEDYINIRARRLPLLDGMEDAEPKDNLWLNDECRVILVRDYKWCCYEPNEWESCDECCARQWCEAYEVEDGV